jgi:hypothetical protein
VSRTARRTLFTAGYVAVGLAAAASVGLLTYRRQFLHFPEPMLSVLLLGLTAALIYASAQMYRIWPAAMAIVLSFVLRVLLTPGSYSLSGAAIYTVLVGVGLVAGAYLQKSLARLRFGRFIGMALATGAGYAVMTLVFLSMPRVDTQIGAFWSQTWLGIKLGAATGLGFELIDLIGPRPGARRRTRRALER